MRAAERTGRDGVRASGARVEELLTSFVRPLPPGKSRANAEALVRELVGLYGTALDRVLEAVDESAGSSAGPVFARLCDDPLVSGLLAIHGLHPLTPLERVTRALDGVRPYIESHKGSVEVLGIEDSVVTLRMEGSCSGCPSSQVTLKLAIERAIFDACPDVSEVRAEAAAEAATSSLSIVSDWIEVEALPDLVAPAGCATFDVSGTPVAILRVGGTLYAYRSRCGACTGDLRSAVVEGEVLTCAHCAHRFDVVHAGRSFDGVNALEPYPLLLVDGRLRLAIPLAV